MTHNNSSQSYFVPLKGTTWSLWRDTVLRSAGFPAHDILMLRDEAAAAAADATTQQELSTACYQDELNAADQRTMTAISEIAQQPLFRKAIAWQNPQLITNCLDRLLVKRPVNGSIRAKQERLASYFQRYTLKNDTIGFFGPVTWATLDDTFAGFKLVSGDNPIAQRATHFEMWAIDAVAHTFAQIPGVEPWIRPERAHGTILIDDTLYHARRQPQQLDAIEQQLWHACDGQTFFKDLIGTGSDAAARQEALTRLRRSDAIIVDLEGFVSATPEAELRRKLALIGEEPLRSRLLVQLDQMVAARDQLDQARTADEVMVATKEVEKQFMAISNSEEASRRPGEMYAGRTLVYQDTLRDMHVQVGRVVLDQLASPLGLMLDSARWLVGRAGEVYRDFLSTQVRNICQRMGRNDIPLGYLVTSLSPHFLEDGSGRLPGPMLALLASFQERWARILGPFPDDARSLAFTSAQLAAAVAREFPYLPSPWVGANVHSPDIMLAAPSPTAVAAGEFMFVLGEMHLVRNSFEYRCLLELHPDVAQLVAAQEAGAPNGRIVGIHPKDSPYVTSRCAPPNALLSPKFTYWTWSDSRAAADVPGHILPGGDLYACDGEARAVVVSRSTGQSYDILNVLGDILHSAVLNAFRPFASAPHLPRITVDRMVIHRESWTFPLEDLEWVFLHDRAASFAAARRWRAHWNLPERVFVKIPSELKPLAVDFASPLLLRLLIRNLRRARKTGAHSISITEMLPKLNDIWLTDAQGRRYTSEFRLVAVDERDGFTHD